VRRRGCQVSAIEREEVIVMKKYTKPQANKVNAGAVLRGSI
jgi:hypothetical protein